jgi:hypothetical protein
MSAAYATLLTVFKFVCNLQILHQLPKRLFLRLSLELQRNLPESLSIRGVVLVHVDDIGCLLVTRLWCEGRGTRERNKGGAKNDGMMGEGSGKL